MVPVRQTGWVVPKLGRTHKAVEIVVDDRGISTAGRLTWAWEAVTSASVVPWAPGSVVVLGSRRTMTLRFSTPEAARSIAEAASAALSERPRPFVFSRVSVQPIRLAAMVLAAVTAASVLGTCRLRDSTMGQLSYLLSGAAMLLAAEVLARVFRFEIDVRADGLCIRKRGSDQFVPFSEIESIDEMRDGVRLRTKDGTAQSWFSTRNHSMQPFALSIRDSHLRDRLRREQRGATGRPTGAQVIAALGQGDYRKAAYPVDVLLRIAEDPTEDIGTRLTAARALGQRAEPVDIARVRIAANQTASSELRACLEQLAEEEAESDAALAERPEIRAER
jgi:hypothetical protein